MRAVLTIILTLPLLAYSQDQINWMTWDQMIAKRQSDSVPKKVFIDLYTGWCGWCKRCLLYTSPSPRDGLLSRMPSSA